MHDLRVLRDQLEPLRESMRRRQTLDALAPLIDRGAALEGERRAMIQAAEERKAARNVTSQEVARRKKAGEDATDLITAGRSLGDEIRRLEGELAATEAELRDILLGLPNLLLADVPDGGEEANRVEKTWGTPRPPDGVRPHWEIGEALGILDLARGAKISGSGFIVFRGLGARLTRALLNYCIDVHVREHGYEEVWVPVVVNRASMIGTSQLPKFEDDMYALRDEGLFLIPTAEVPVTNLYRDEILDGGELPRGFVAYTPCFRREAGAARRTPWPASARVRQGGGIARPSTGTPTRRLTRRGDPTRTARPAVPPRPAVATPDSPARAPGTSGWAPGGKWPSPRAASPISGAAREPYRPAPGESQFLHTLNGRPRLPPASSPASWSTSRPMAACSSRSCGRTSAPTC